MTEFLLPWSVQELDACFVVMDSNRQKIAHVYFEDDSRRRSAAKLLSRDQHCGLQINFAGLLKWLRMICLAFKKEAERAKHISSEVAHRLNGEAGARRDERRLSRINFV